MTEITQADRDAAARSFASDHDVPMDCAVCKAILSGEEDDQEIVTRFALHRMEERAAIVAWLRSENGRCDCFAYEDIECACGGRYKYKTWPLEHTAVAIEAGEHLK